MDKQEKIVCAAIQFRPYICEHDGFGDKTELNGCSYDEIRSSFAYEYLCVTGSSKDEKEGFITSKNRFVDAKEAMKIAVEENQIEAIRKVFDAIPNFHDKGIDSHEFGEAANAAIDIRDEYLARELKPEDLY
ncbi:hypothetical protein [Wohlfahrtiimonas populi]|uniref:hypothetical protein n=1 Tax=Wohlfahrtiimonas populi TaxID=1940240 RepID=UPI00098D4A4A|nr:hypothetical protein [Wohlfahrtiimonas populi]